MKYFTWLALTWFLLILTIVFTPEGAFNVFLTVLALGLSAILTYRLVQTIRGGKVRWTVWLILMAVLLALAIYLTPVGALNLLFGWIPFLARVAPNLTVDVPSVIVGAVALGLFVVLVHCLGKSIQPWKARWTVATVLGVLILFTSGVAVVGMAHQVAWLATSDVPLKSEALKREYGDSTHRSREIGLATLNYESTYLSLPPGGTFSADGQMLHSWESQLLNYIPYARYGIDYDRPWNDPKNQPYFKGPLSAFINPGFRTQSLEDEEGYGLSHYACNRRVMAANTKTKVADFPNGASNAIIIGEVNANFKPWGHPVNWRDPAIGLNKDPKGFGGPPGTNGVIFIMADGSTRFIGNNINPAVLRALSDPLRKENSQSSIVEEQ